MSQQTLFGALRNAGQLLEVEMNDLKIFLPNSGKRAIGTTSLNGCSCVVILGRTAILLAHISPLPEQQPGDNTRNFHEQSHDHHEKFMADVASIIRQHADHFPPSSTAWGIFSCGRESAGPIQSIVHQIQAQLSAIGYTMRPAFYEVMDAHAMVPPKGELVSFFNTDNIAELWLERTKLWPKQQPSLESASTPRASTSQASTSQASTSQAAAEGQWFGYPLQSNAQRGATLLCVISDQDCVVNVTWSQGQQYPMVFLWNEWIQTEYSAGEDALIVCHDDTRVQLQRRRA